MQQEMQEVQDIMQEVQVCMRYRCVGVQEVHGGAGGVGVQEVQELKGVHEVHVCMRCRCAFVQVCMTRYRCAGVKVCMEEQEV